jgi:hypothetical protein
MKTLSGNGLLFDDLIKDKAINDPNGDALDGILAVLSAFMVPSELEQKGRIDEIYKKEGMVF